MTRKGFSFVPMAIGFSLLLSLTPYARAVEKQPLLAGAAKLDSTPPNLDGLTTLWKKPYAGIHDHIFIRALVVDNGKNIAGFLTADLVEFGDTTALRARIEKEVGIPADHLILSASHDHAAPRAGKMTPGSQAYAGGSATATYSAWLDNQIVAAFKQAKTSEQPARVGISTGRSYVNTNRNEYYSQAADNPNKPEVGWGLGVNYDRPSDKTVWVVKFETLNGDPIAVLFNYGVHSVVAGPDNDQLTGDLAGAAERYVEAHYNGKAVALYTMGPAGDQNPVFIGPGQQPQEAAPIFQAVDAEGFMLGAEVVRVAVRIKDMSETASISAAQKVISCPTRPKENAGQQDNPRPPKIDLLLGLIRVNDIAFTGISAEVVTNIYYHLKKASPLTNTIMITIANDRMGYIVDDASYDLPIFELSGAPLARGCSEEGVVNGLVELIQKTNY